MSRSICMAWHSLGAMQERVGVWRKMNVRWKQWVKKLKEKDSDLPVHVSRHHIEG